MKYIIWIVLAGIFASTGCNSQQSNRGFDVTQAQYAVYSDLIQAQYINPSTDTLVIEEQTAVGDYGTKLDETLRYVSTNMEGADPDLFTDFKNRNRSASQLEQRFTFKIKVVFLTKAENDQIFNGQGSWKPFYEKYPNSPGILTISNVGFNRPGNQALVYVGRQSDFLAGAGFIVWLVKETGHWTIKQQVMIWIS